MRRRLSATLSASLSAALAVVVAVGLSLGTIGTAGSPAVSAAGKTARILLGAPSTLDPAAQGDAGSAAVTAQAFESLTAFDAQRDLQPALAASWQVEDGGRRIVFQLRPGLAFSDGSPLVASDVIRSWLRLLDPAAPSPLVTLLLGVNGASGYLGGTAKAADVGLVADDGAGTVTVSMTRPAADFVAVVAGPSFGVVPRSAGTDRAAFQPGPAFVASGGYVLTGLATDGLTLQANPHYWAGPPAISTITLVSDLAGASGTQAFADGKLDYAPVGDADAAWLAYDRDLGPQLRTVASLSTEYYGFDTSRAPFDDVRVRQAFAAAVDWRGIARLALSDPAGVATSLVPPGIPGRSDRDVLPAHDPAAGRALLAAAGFPGGAGFPSITLLTGGTGYDLAVVTQLEAELGVTVQVENMGFDTYFQRLATDPPAMWSLAWVADYPGRNDFLGVLLSTGASNNYGRWSSAEFDVAITAAGSSADETTASAAYDRAEAIVQRDVPVIPIAYGTGWALARTGLLGAGQNGLGILRLAGLAWAE